MASDDDVDPLDAFMATLDVPASGTRDDARATTTRDDDDDDDDAFGLSMAMLGARAATRRATDADADEEEEDDARATTASDDDDDAGDARGRRGRRDSLREVDHAREEYEKFERVTYVAPKELADVDVGAARAAADARASGGAEDVAPISRFGQGGALDVDCLRALRRMGYESPTAVQAQCLPVIWSGHDALVMAKTGSGKTLAFLLPAYAQISRQRPLTKREGPIALVLAPTRELASQIANEAHKFTKFGVSGARCCAIFGGVSKRDQFKKLRAGAEIVVATPGRLVDVLCMKNSTTLRRVTYLALDEADRMLDMGFEKIVRSICQAVRPDRQCVMFSATMPAAMQRLARDVLARDAVTVSIGNVGGANEDVRQVVYVFEDDARRAAWLFENLGDAVDEGQAIVFVNHKSSVEELVNELATRGIKAVALHGDLDQAQRQFAMKAFKSEHAHVLVATDVAARGLDVEAIKTVVNFHPARDMSTHVHRIGRTGRAGALDGRAYTLFTARDSAKFAQQLEQNLEAAGQPVPLDLKALARGTYNKRLRSDHGGDAPRHGKVGGRGLGFTSHHRPSAGGGAFGGGRGGAARPAPSADFTAVPPPSQTQQPQAPNAAAIIAQARAKAEAIAKQLQAPAMVSVPNAAAIIAQARAKAEAIAKQLNAPAMVSVPPPPPPAPVGPAAAAAAAAAAIAARLAAQAPPPNP